MKKGTILITLGLLLITAALCLTGYNLYESWRAGEASDSVLEQLEQRMEEGTAEEISEDVQADGTSSFSDPARNHAEGSDIDNTNNKENTVASASAEAEGSDSSEENDSGADGGMNLGELYPDRDMPSLSVNSIGYIGYLSIPSLSLRLPVQSDWIYDLLTISPSRYSGSVYQNNMIIGGHSYITHFRGLRTISPGAKVIFYDTEGFTYTYEVSYVMTLNPTQGRILFDEEEDWDLTLFTCNTGGQTRCIVRCVRVE